MLRFSALAARPMTVLDNTSLCRKDIIGDFVADIFPICKYPFWYYCSRAIAESADAVFRLILVIRLGQDFAFI